MKSLVRCYQDETHNVVNFLGIKIKWKHNKDNKVSQNADWEIYDLNIRFKDILKWDLLEKYKRLTNNLSDVDTKKVNKIVAALVKIVNGEPINKADYIDGTYEFEPVIKFNDECYLGYGYYMPRNQFENCVFYEKHGIGVVENLEKIRLGDFIDAGACLGESALVLSKYTDGKIHSFEPMKRLYSLMLKTIKMNNKTNIVPVNKALGDKEEKVIVDSFALLIDEKNSLPKEEIHITTIDNYVEKNDIRVSLIKTDIEGAEQSLLRGAIETIKRDKPVLLISIYHNADDFFNIKTMIEDLNLGYKFKIEKEKTVIVHETMLICEVR